MTATQIIGLTLVAQDTSDKITARICRRLSLGIDTSMEQDMAYLIQNYIFSLSNGNDVLTNANYNDLLERVNILYNKCNKFW
jgi:hypothetical protein